MFVHNDRTDSYLPSHILTQLPLEIKLYKQTPNNGLVLFCGVILLDDGKTEKKMVIDIEPFLPLTQFSYKCQNRFYTEPL